MFHHRQGQRETSQAQKTSDLMRIRVSGESPFLRAFRGKLKGRRLLHYSSENSFVMYFGPQLKWREPSPVYGIRKPYFVRPSFAIPHYAFPSRNASDRRMAT